MSKALCQCWANGTRVCEVHDLADDPGGFECEWCGDPMEDDCASCSEVCASHVADFMSATSAPEYAAIIA